jgi:hypothetical protein
MHFIPTSSSWLNMVERFFREITTKRIRRGNFTSVDDLIAAISDYIDGHNGTAKVGLLVPENIDLCAENVACHVQRIVIAIRAGEDDDAEFHDGEV